QHYTIKNHQKSKLIELADSSSSSMSNEVSYTNELQPSESPYPSHSLNLHPDPVYGGNEVGLDD
ncbi:hypothetical protein PROFUN_17161, partial [Planoprotostelium fungivorum]